ncbi:putative RNA-directed DNA polymerase from transposon X-element [Trichonephila clavipes]|nr:putative RNA-directed DNA polymerase from transposon X-element [Trichonephila clavipes]
MTYRNDRLTHRGCGAAIIIKRTIAHHSIDIHTTSLQNTSIVIEGSQKITICCIYRPPKSPPQALVPDLLRILGNRTKCFIVGDLNARHITWSPHSKNKCGTLLKKFIGNCGFLLSYSSQPSTVPTRANVRPATIDFGISCGLDDILVETHSELSSDHNPQSNSSFLRPIIGCMPRTVLLSQIGTSSKKFFTQLSQEIPKSAMRTKSMKK